MKTKKLLREKPAVSDSFFDKVFHVARLIPKGRITSYGAIANYLGTKGSSRMVGWAMNLCHHSKYPVPAHRVVNRNGLLTGKHHFGGPHVMEELLESEGVEVDNDKVVNFEKLFWDPAKEIEVRVRMKKRKIQVREQQKQGSIKIKKGKNQKF